MGAIIHKNQIQEGGLIGEGAFIERSSAKLNHYGMCDCSVWKLNKLFSKSNEIWLGILYDDCTSKDKYGQTWWQVNSSQKHFISTSDQIKLSP